MCVIIYIYISVRWCTYWRADTWPQKWAVKCCKLPFWVSTSSHFSKPSFSLPLSTTVGFKRPSPSHFFTWWPIEFSSKVHLQSLQKPWDPTSAFQLPHNEEGHTMMAWPPPGHPKATRLVEESRWLLFDLKWSMIVPVFFVRKSCCPRCGS